MLVAPKSDELPMPHSPFLGIALLTLLSTTLCASAQSSTPAVLPDPVPPPLPGPIPNFSNQTVLQDFIAEATDLTLVVNSPVIPPLVPAINPADPTDSRNPPEAPELLGRNLSHPYIIPGGFYFHQFDWDSYFVGIALLYKQVTDPIIGVVQNFLDQNGRFYNIVGYIPRELSPYLGFSLPDQCKPFLAQMALQASLVKNDFSWFTIALPVPPGHLQEVLKPRLYNYYTYLQDFINYWETYRQTSDGLFSWTSAVESGIDRSFAIQGYTVGVDLQVYMDREYLAMAGIADHLNVPADAKSYREKAATLKRAIQNKMWFEDDGTFYNLNPYSGKPIRVPEWTNLTPILNHIASEWQAHILIERHLLNMNEFWANFGVRTLSRTSPHYNLTFRNTLLSYWNGPVWVVSNYLLMHGLLNYGYRKEAIELANKTIAVLVNDFRNPTIDVNPISKMLGIGGMHEIYNPETGSESSPGDFISWDLLGLHMLDEAVYGSDPTSTGLDPR